MNVRQSRLFFAFVLFACGAFYLISVPSMPDVIATLFAGDGSAKGYMKRSVYFPYVLVIGIGLPLLLALLLSVLPNILSPRYFMFYSGGKRVLGESKLAVVTTFGWLYASFTAIFSASMHRLVAKANQLDPPHLANIPFFILLVGFLTATFIWLAVVIVRLRRDTGESDS